MAGIQSSEEVSARPCFFCKVFLTPTASPPVVANSNKPRLLPLSVRIRVNVALMPGYDLKVNGEYARLKSLQCSACSLILKDAIQLWESGLRFCKTCWDDDIR